jgi:hypothetical protein
MRERRERERERERGIERERELETETKRERERERQSKNKQHTSANVRATAGPRTSPIRVQTNIKCLQQGTEPNASTARSFIFGTHAKLK